jgi:hypothetical protein
MDVKDIAYRNFRANLRVIHVRITLGDADNSSIQHSFCNEVSQEFRNSLTDEETAFFESDGSIEFVDQIYQSTDPEVFVNLFAKTIQNGHNLVQKLIDASGRSHRYVKVLAETRRSELVRNEMYIYCTSIRLNYMYSITITPAEMIESLKCDLYTTFKDLLYTDIPALSPAENQYIVDYFTLSRYPRRVFAPAALPEPIIEFG